MGAHDIQTGRMRLIPATAELARLEVDDRAALGLALKADVPENWPPELAADAIEWFASQLEANPGWAGWMGWYGVILDRGKPVLGGGGGFLGPPLEGTVEVGYSMLPQFYRQGYGGEMVRALVEWAFSHDDVELVHAEVHRTNLPSLSLLRRINFAECGDGKEPGHVRLGRRRAVADG